MSEIQFWLECALCKKHVFVERGVVFRYALHHDCHGQTHNIESAEMETLVQFWRHSQSKEKPT